MKNTRSVVKLETYLWILCSMLMCFVTNSVAVDWDFFASIVVIEMERADSLCARVSVTGQHFLASKRAVVLVPVAIVSRSVVMKMTMPIVQLQWA